MPQTLQLDGHEATLELDGKLEPVTEFRLFAYGTNDTTQGAIELTASAAAKVMAVYEKRTKARGGILDIDWYHLSRKADARLEDRRSAGRCKLALREDGIWVTDIKPTAEAKRALEADEVRSYSPVVRLNAKGQLAEIGQLSLTNIPSMDDAGLLAAEDQDDDIPIKPELAGNDKERPPMPELKTLQTTPRVELLLLADGRWNNEVRSKLSMAISARLGDCSYLDDFTDAKLRVSQYAAGVSKFYEIPYTLSESGDVGLGDAQEVVMSYVPKAQASEAMALQERNSTLAEKVVELTKVDSTTEQIIMLESTFKAAGDRPDLQRKVLSLEAQLFEHASSTLIKEAKERGAWSKANEEEASEKADMARRLLEDPVGAIKRFWARREVIVAPAGFRPPKPPDTTLELSEDEEETAKTVADRMNRPIAEVRISLLDEKRARAART